MKSALAFWTFVLTVFFTVFGESRAQERQAYREVTNQQGDVIFRLDLYGENSCVLIVEDYDYWSYGDFSETEIDTMARGLQYWSEILMSDAAPVTPVVIRAFHMKETDYDAHSYGLLGLNGGTLSYNILAQGIDPGLFPSGVPGDDVEGFHAFLDFSRLDWDAIRNTWLVEGTASLEMVMIHEFGHSLGIMAGISNWRNLLDRDGDHTVFVGPEAMAIYGDYQASRPVPIGTDDDSHFGLQNGMMTHMHNRNYSAFMEVELASLRDLGYTRIDLRNFFGRSVYTDGNTIVNDTGFYKSKGLDADGNWRGYEIGAENTGIFGLGLHIYGSDNHVVQAADLLSSGMSGAGIRVDGFRNTVVINPDTKVYADGDSGTGLLVAFGTDHYIVHRGDLQATGTGLPDLGPAIGARFDFGPNMQTEASVKTFGSYGYTYDVNGEAVRLLAPLVHRFDVTGSIAGTDAAIYIAENAHVRAINIMAGAEIHGDIISDFDFHGKKEVFEYVQETYGPVFPFILPGGGTTYLNFGLEADAQGMVTGLPDANFDFVVDGKIYGYGNTDVSDRFNGRGLIDITLHGGQTTFSENADVRVRWLTASPDTRLVLKSDVNVHYLNLENASLKIENRPDKSPMITVGKAAQVLGGTVEVAGTIREGLRTIFINAENLNVVDPLTLVGDGGGKIQYGDYSYWYRADGRSTIYSEIAETDNQRRFGLYWDVVSTETDWVVMDEFLARTDGWAMNDPGKMRRGMDELSGNLYGTIGTASVLNTTIVNGTLAEYLRRDPLRQKNPSRDKSHSCVRNTWALGFGMGGATRSDGNAFGYDQSFGGTVFGVDGSLRKLSRIGFYGSYGEGHVATDGLIEKSKSKELMLGGYLRREMRVGYLTAHAGLGTNRYDTTRTSTVFDFETSNRHDALTGTVYVERGVEFVNSGVRFQPYVSLQYVGIRQDGFKEDEMLLLGIDGDATTTHSIRSFLGARIRTKDRRIGGGTFSLNAAAAWMHEFDDAATSFRGATVWSPTPELRYEVYGHDPGRDWAIVGLGAHFDRSRVRFFGGYDAFVNDRQVMHTGNAGLVVGW